MDLNWKKLLDGKPQNKIEMSLITTGWWFEPLLKKWWSSSVGMMTFPIYGKIKFMFQTTNQVLIWWFPLLLDTKNFPDGPKKHGQPPTDGSYLCLIDIPALLLMSSKRWNCSNEPLQLVLLHLWHPGPRQDHHNQHTEAHQDSLVLRLQK